MSCADERISDEPMSDELEFEVREAIDRQGRAWIRVLAVVVAQKVVVCGFAFTLRAYVYANKERLIYSEARYEERFQKLEDNQRDLIRVLVVVEQVQKQMAEIVVRLDGKGS